MLQNSECECDTTKGTRPIPKGKRLVCNELKGELTGQPEGDTSEERVATPEDKTRQPHVTSRSNRSLNHNRLQYTV